MKRLFVFSGVLLAVCLALGIAAWTLPGTVRVAHADANPPCSASSPTLPCTVGGTLEVLSLSGNLFMSGGGGGGGGGGCGGGGATATIINDPLNPGFTLMGNSPCTFAASGTPVTFSRSEDIGLASVSGLATIEDISASITCGASGNATLSLTFSTPGGGSVTLNCPHEASAGAVETVSGHATFTPVSAFTDTITLSGSGTTSNDIATLSGFTLQVSIGVGGPSFTITKTDNGPFTVGTNGTYTITVTNTGGAATSSTITVTDTLPAGLTFIVGTGTGWTCSASGQMVTCTSTTPISGGGGTSMIALTVSVGVVAVPSVSNTASVSGGGATRTATSPTDTTVVKMTVKSGPAVNISTFAGQQIVVVDGAVGTTAAILTVPIPTDTNNFLPEDIVVGPDKRIYICDPALSKIHRVRQDGMQFETVYDMSTATPPNNPGLPEGPSFKGSDLYFNTASATGGTGVWKIAGAAAVAFGGSFNAPTHVLTQAAAGEGTAFGTAGTTSGQLLAVEKSTNQVLSCNPSSCASPTILIQNSGEGPRVLNRPFGIAVNSAGDIFVANGGSILQNVNHFGPDGTFIETYASFSGKGFPVFLEFDALDRLYVVTNADPTAAGGKVWRIDPPGGETNLVFLVALSTSIPGVASDEAVGLGVAPTAFLTQHYSVSSTPLKKQFAFSTTGDEVDITFPAVGTAFNLTVFREEIPEALLGLQLATNFANIPCAEYNSDRGTCVVYEEGVGSKLNPLPPADYTGPVDFQVFYPGIGTIGPPVLAHARDDMLQTPVDQYDENELTGFTLATSLPLTDPTGMDGSSGGLSRHVALNTPLVLAGTTFCGFDPPVAQGGLTFSKPQTIAIKFRIAASGGSCAAGPFITNAASQLWLFDVTTSTFITPGPSGDSSAPNFFHVDTTSGENLFNLSTKNLAPGTYIFTMTSNSVSAQFSFFFLTQ